MRFQGQRVIQLAGGFASFLVIFLVCGGLVRRFEFSILQSGSVVAPGISFAVATMVFIQLWNGMGGRQTSITSNEWFGLGVTYVVGFGFIFVVEGLLAVPPKTLIDWVFPTAMAGADPYPYDAILHMGLLSLLYLLFIVWDFTTWKYHPARREQHEAWQAFRYLNLPTLISSLIVIVMLLISGKSDSHDSTESFVHGVVAFHIFAAAGGYLVVQCPHLVRRGVDSIVPGA